MAKGTGKRGCHHRQSHPLLALALEEALVQVSFVVELSYASLFGIRNVSEDAVGQIMLIQAPTLMFPFARRIIADAVRDGGFPPLMLDPISFEALYRQQAEQAAAEGNGEAGDVSESITVN